MKTADSVSPALAQPYEVGGRCVVARFTDEPSFWSITRFLERWQLTPLERAANVRASMDFAVGPAPTLRASEELRLPDGGVCHASDDAYAVVLPNYASIHASASPEVRIWLSKPVGEADEQLPVVASHAVAAALRRADLFELHSGCVVSPDGKCSVLLCGPSGSGKSTLALQLAAAGWSYLSDDIVLLKVVEDAVTATGFRKFFALTHDTVERCGVTTVSAQLASAFEHEQQKVSFVPEKVFPAGSISECRPNVLMLTRIVNSPTSRTRELNATEAMLHLIRLAPWSCYDRAVAPSFLELLATLVKQTTCLELLAGADLLGDPEFTARFLTAEVEKRAS